ncbi:MAG: divalent metal cation transporter [Rhodothermales bacterium]|nr:divalent metal cation transporter [Rhodothermales bacterium]
MRLGTSSLVVAAFVGPGTVLTCATAGVGFGYELAWVLLFATAAAFVLQSFTAGTGILAGKGLGEAMREAAARPAQRALLFGLVVLGLWAGCAAFEAGNLVGAAAGLVAVLGLGEGMLRWVVGGIAAVAALVLLLDLRAIVQALAGLVALMSVLFLATLFVAPVDWSAALAGLVTPSLPPEGLLTVVALIGTTIVTYNLFLHAAAARRYWQGDPPQRAWRRELRGMALFLPLGGLISLAILWAGATLQGADVGSVAALAALLEPVAGSAARFFFGLGLLAAGVTSAVTAPLAAAAGIRELFGWPDDPRDRRYRAVWGTVVLTGLVFGMTDLSPLSVIVAAQAANGLLLPFIAAFVLYLGARQRAVTLPRWYLAAGALVTLVCAGLGARTLWWVWNQVF